MIHAAARSLLHLRSRLLCGGPSRGDVPGWVLITVMTAGLVLVLWEVAEGQLTDMFTSAVESVRDPNP